MEIDRKAARAKRFDEIRRRHGLSVAQLAACPVDEVVGYLKKLDPIIDAMQVPAWVAEYCADKK